MTPSEALIINNELDHMKETYGLEYQDYGFTGTESYRVALAIIQDREEAFKSDNTGSNVGHFIITFDDGSRDYELTIQPGFGIALDKDRNAPGGCTLKAWHDYDKDSDDCFDKAALTPDMEDSFSLIASEFREVYARAERLFGVPQLTA